MDKLKITRDDRDYVGKFRKISDFDEKIYKYEKSKENLK